VCRGGYWGYLAGHCRSAHRGAFSSEDRNRLIGFRVALVSSPPQSKPDDPSATDSPAAPQMVELPNGWQIGEPVNVGPPISTLADEYHPTVSGDGRTFVFESHNRPGEPAAKCLWMCTRPNISQPWGKPEAVGSVLSDALLLRFELSVDGLTLLFESDQPGGAGGLDLWMVTRPSREEPFGPPSHLGVVVNSPDDDAAPSLTSDGLTLLFLSNRPGGQGENDLWMSTRSTVDQP